MRTGSRTIKLLDRMKAGRTRIQSRNPRFRTICGGIIRATGRTCRLASVLMLLLAVNTGAMPDHPSERSLATAPYTTASLLKTPVGRGLVVEGVTVTKEEILWLARAIYSETKRPHEQELVAWVVRNRVETGYRGNATYAAAVLDRYQFSAFNPNAPTRSFYMSLDWSSTTPGFQTALAIAARVASAPEQERPFSRSTRHFYSARSMVNGRTPAWAADRHPVRLDRDIDPERFRFYERIA